MRRSVIFFAVLVLSSPAFGQNHAAPSVPAEQFEIGRRTFFDFGPPFNYYDLFVVRPTVKGTSIERITLTPPVDSCTRQAKVELASGSINGSIAALLGSTNPCAISGKELHRELKRCKHCMGYSGSIVAMEVQCGGRSRLMRSDILDKDMFDPAANTPKHTEWTMQLLRRLDEAVGPGVMAKPMFPVSAQDQSSPQNADSSILEDLSSGKYDALFQGAPDKPSDLYPATRINPPTPTIRLLSSTPVEPTVFVAPKYPPIAKLAHVEGSVSLNMFVDSSGNVTSLSFESGSPLLQSTVKNASDGWKFPEGSAAGEIHAVIEFSLHCLPPPK
jgi:hypothetical protein